MTKNLDLKLLYKMQVLKQTQFELGRFDSPSPVPPQPGLSGQSSPKITRGKKSPQKSKKSRKERSNSSSPTGSNAAKPGEMHRDESRNSFGEHSPQPIQPWGNSRDATRDSAANYYVHNSLVS